MGSENKAASFIECQSVCTHKRRIGSLPNESEQNMQQDHAPGPHDGMDRKLNDIAIVNLEGRRIFIQQANVLVHQFAVLNRRPLGLVLHGSRAVNSRLPKFLQQPPGDWDFFCNDVDRASSRLLEVLHCMFPKERFIVRRSLTAPLHKVAKVVCIFGRFGPINRFVDFTAEPPLSASLSNDSNEWENLATVSDVHLVDTLTFQLANKECMYRWKQCAQAALRLHTASSLGLGGVPMPCARLPAWVVADMQENECRMWTAIRLQESTSRTSPGNGVDKLGALPDSRCDVGSNTCAVLPYSVDTVKNLRRALRVMTENLQEVQAQNEELRIERRCSRRQDSIDSPATTLNSVCTYATLQLRLAVQHITPSNVLELVIVATTP